MKLVQLMEFKECTCYQIGYVGAPHKELQKISYFNCLLHSPIHLLLLLYNRNEYQLKFQIDIFDNKKPI